VEGIGAIEEGDNRALSRSARNAFPVYARDGAAYLIVASKGGADQPPAWLLNLEAKPQVEIQIGPSVSGLHLPRDLEC
jgi:F420H(2)-dependent quinone reductase